ncbi:unnamed protein product [Sphagnum troendelagicum]
MKTRQKVYISPAAVAKAAKKVPRRSAKKSVVPEEAAAAATERELVSVAVVPHEDLAGSGIVTEPSEEEIAAQEFLASLHEKLEGCVSSPQVDVHCFAKRLVTESRSALRILAKREIHCSEQKQKEVEQPTGTREQRLATVAVESKGLEGAALCSEIQNAQTFEDESSADEKLAKQLATMLLVKPKRLARQFKDCRSPSSSVLATTNSTAFQGCNPVRTVQEKVRSFELQIMLRMELTECDSDEKNFHVEDICELLDSIQFDIDGVVCGGESLQEYSVRVIHTRYKDYLPHTVSAIFHAMEFNGYSTPNPTAWNAKVRMKMEDEDSKLDRRVKHSEKRPEKLDSLQGPTMRTETQDQSTSPKDCVNAGNSAKDQHVKVPVVDKGLLAIHLTQASEQKKQAIKRKHYGGPIRHLKLKQVRLKNHALKNVPKVSNTAPVKCEPTKCNVVNETPMVNCRQQMFSDTSRDPVSNPEVGLLPTQVVLHGFQTPAYPLRPSETASRKRGLFPSGLLTRQHYVPCTVFKENSVKGELPRQHKLGAALQHSAFCSPPKVLSELCQ